MTSARIETSAMVTAANAVRAAHDFATNTIAATATRHEHNNPFSLATWSAFVMQPKC